MAQSNTRVLMKKAEASLQDGKGRETIDYCKQVLRLSPGNSKALATIGKVYQSAGHYPQAEDFYRQAVQADPRNADHVIGLTYALSAQSKFEAALAAAQQAVAAAPDSAESHLTLVKMLLRYSNTETAQQYLETIPQLMRNHTELWCCYCLALKMNEQGEKAAEEYAALLKARRVPLYFRMTYETYVPRLLVSAEAITRTREELVASIERFAGAKEPLDIHKLNDSLFYLAFHNRDNRAIASRFREVMRMLAPELNYVAPHAKTPPEYVAGKPITVGFCSRFMHNHSVGRCYRNALLHLHRDPRFKVILFTLNQNVDDAIRGLQEEGVEIVPLPKHIVSAQQLIASRTPDILVDPETGMHAMTYFLAYARLAPYQCCLTGHPDTTGLDTMDYFISSALYEPPNGQENYTETLLRVPVIDSVLTPPKAPERWLSRAELGLPEDKKLYVCPMAIQKMHPDYDEVLADILARDPGGMLVLFNDFQLESASAMLQQRILAKCPAERVIFLPWQPLDRLFSILKTADAVLSTIYFGAGTTGQFCVGFGIPMVSLPGEFARSRMVAGFYARMGIEDAPIATDAAHYAELAVKVANDPAYRERVSQQLLAKNHLLFGDNGYGPVLAQLLEDVMKQKLDAYRA